MLVLWVYNTFWPKLLDKFIHVRGHPELSSFSREYTEYAGGGVKGCHTLFTMLIMMHCIFIRGSPKATFSKYSFWREGGCHKNEYSVYAFDKNSYTCIHNVDTYGRPLMSKMFSLYMLI